MTQPKTSHSQETAMSDNLSANLSVFLVVRKEKWFLPSHFAFPVLSMILTLPLTLPTMCSQPWHGNAGIAGKFWDGSPWHVFYCFQLLKHGISSTCFLVYSWRLVSSLRSCFQVRLGLFQRYRRLLKVYFKNAEGPKSFPVVFLQRQTYQN